MDDFRITFDGNISLPDGYNLGVQGEHNAVQLVITLPDSMVQDMSYHVVTLGGVQSAIITDAAENADGAYRSGNTIYMPLTAAYTKSCNVDLTVTAYRQIGSVPTVVDKTPTVYGLRFSAGDAVDIQGGLVAQVAEIAKAQHTHPNKPTLDRLTEVDGTLYLDGKRLGGVVVWHIVDDPVKVPSMADGTLLFVVPGINGDMSYQPYKVLVLGAVVTRIAPWKPGQLWVCRGGVWYLLASANRQEYTPEDVLPDAPDMPEDIEIPDDVGGSAPGGSTPSDIIDSADDPYNNVDTSNALAEAIGALQQASHTHANMDALERIGQDTDDVVLMPMGEPLHLMMREDFGSAPMYAMESFIRQNDPKYDFYVDGTDGTRIRILFDGATVFDVEVNGSASAELPENFAIASINGYASLEEMPADMLDAYRTFCSFVNTSVEAMGSGVPKPGKAEIPTRGLMWNRTYVLRLDYDSIEITFAEDADDGLTTEEAYTTGYVYFPQDLDAAISGVDYFIGDAPQTTQGWHQWILSRLPNGQRTLSAQPLQNAA